MAEHPDKHKWMELAAKELKGKPVRIVELDDP